MDNLAKLMAIEEIKQLKARYCRFIDTRDFEALEQVFTKDARFERAKGDPSAGRDAIMTFIRDSYASLNSIHHCLGHEITVDSETEAHGIVAMKDFARTLDGKDRLADGAGHYHETYRVEDGVWRISSIKLNRLYLDWLGPPSA